MEELSKIYLKKNYEDQNSVYMFLKSTKNKKYYILKSIDTITDEEEIICIENDKFMKEFYCFQELIKQSNYVGKSGYYNKMNPFEKEIYKSFVILYKDNLHELLYDTILDTYFLAGSIFDLEDFVSVSDKPK
ncbi:MAG: hypothetical protein ACI4PE_04620, partial [Bacilli bacterium]